MRNLLKKPVFLKGNAAWLSELPSVIKQNSNTIHSSTKMKPINAFKEANEKRVYSNLQDRRVRQQPRSKLGQLVRTVDIKRVFSKGDSTKWSNKLYTITEVIHDTIPSYRIDYPLERYNENLLRTTNLALEQNNQDMEELYLHQ